MFRSFRHLVWISLQLFHDNEFEESERSLRSNNSLSLSVESSNEASRCTRALSRQQISNFLVSPDIRDESAFRPNLLVSGRRNSSSHYSHGLNVDKPVKTLHRSSRRFNLRDATDLAVSFFLTPRIIYYIIAPPNPKSPELKYGLQSGGIVPSPHLAD